MAVLAEIHISMAYAWLPSTMGDILAGVQALLSAVYE